MNDLYLPPKVETLIRGRAYDVDSVGLSGSTVITFSDRVLKIEPCREETEKMMQVLAWAQDKLPVPRILHHEVLAGKSYLLMSRVQGQMACDPVYMENADSLTDLLAQGLCMLWKTDIRDCPRRISLEDELKIARKHAAKGLGRQELEGTPFASADELLFWLEKNKPGFDPVMSHGDYCLPNVLLDGARIAGFIDLGNMAVNDRYVDIVDCYLSLKNNYGGVFGGKVYPDFDPEIFLKKLPIQVDREKLLYYQYLGLLL